MSESPDNHDASQRDIAAEGTGQASVPGQGPSPKPTIDGPITLPPVQPPSATFILQLFVIPLVIVSIIVMVWLMFSWLAHMGSNPRDMVRDLKKLNDVSWQRALTLADVLRNPAYDELKDDVEMATDLSAILETQIASGNTEEPSVKLRMFLCRALGEFRVAEVVPVLVTAATTERAPAEIDVRRAALQALAVFANQQGTSFTHRDDMLEAVLEISRERSESGADKPLRDELRSTAAFVLGVMGDPAALDRLALMLTDSHANSRYNAALGLTRHGDPRAIDVLLEMLDPANEESAKSEPTESAKSSKRLAVIKNGIEGAAQLATNNRDLEADEVDQLVAALQTIIDSELTFFHFRVRRGIQINAKESLLKIRASQVAGATTEPD